jgi:predicted aminopeptidase
MVRFFKLSRRARRWVSGGLVVLALVLVCGCRNLSFYGQAIRGEYQMLAHRNPVDKLVTNSNTDAKLKEKLSTLLAMLSYASNDLRLPVDNQYHHYVDLHRPYAVWNVEAAPEFSLEKKSWWYPFVGSLDYRGYFSQEGAEKYAAWLRKKDLDVYVGGVEAYSTLGWFKDPALNTFIFEPEADLAEILFHELGHQRLFVSGDTDFNEAFATTVGQEGAKRWLRSRKDQAGLDAYLAELRRHDQFVEIVARCTRQLEKLYGDVRTPDGKLKAGSRETVSVEELRRQKQAILEKLQEDYRALKAQWNGSNDYDGWFALPINNAQLNSISTYYDLVPAFERMLKDNNDDLEKFYRAAERLSKEPREKRHLVLRSLLAPG